MIEKKHVDGKNKGEILIYALSTCGWCRKAKNILKQLGIAYDYIDVDLLSDEKSTKIENEEVKKWNPACTYPTIVINNQRSINKFNEDKIRELGQ
ncbi:NrdH-redoxin [candidate division WOR-1 bacterium RIFCSPHIGHO2_01_FULL_53_15]|uniref:NrdH-redoxin n=1 Tax=candidate division WOR-1 bacterium RIFCSPHIGHO2_01_FULL_53_15 TaxID=1802564 RepID=A0A1F4PZE7_UNCSA|nr:MAG: NrdH-redoxin [candidate division WOR-1 bacterium RIFCSPHIGHO2_01_FULL_53_15]OGC10649.1 MAG: NrdH-redoxin [candidate division WOR-1 bacterium RIFCSPHIGHO2_02_FULL_53_26]